MRTIFTYGDGIPRYLGLWLLGLPVLLVVLWRCGVRRGALLAVALSTLPTLWRNPPLWFGLPLRIWVLGALTVFIFSWLVARVRSRAADAEAVTSTAEPLNWQAVVALIALALAIRIPLAWLDPGISDIPTATEIAANQLLDGDNPYTLENPDTTIGEYQYPAGTLLLNLPFVALVPDRVAGEDHFGVRVCAWVTEAAAVALLAWAGARFGRARAGLVAGAAYALHPALWREAGQTVANDMALALLVTGAVIALALSRSLLAGVLVGLAITVKPAAVVVLPVLLVAVGWQPVVLAVAVAAAVQLPFLMWPTVGLHGVEAIAEPVARGADGPTLRAFSLWWPFFIVVGTSRAMVSLASWLGLFISGGIALWAGYQVRTRGPSLTRIAAACALPLLASYALAALPRTNYQIWYLTPFLLSVALSQVRNHARVPTGVAFT